jgi:hypothetical protein
MAGITFNPDEMQSLVVKAIMDGISEDQKTSIIGQAVAALMKESDQSGYGRKESVLQHAFAGEVRNAAFRAAEEYIREHDEIYGRIKAGIWDLLDKMPEGTLQDYDVQDAVITALLMKLRDR